MPPSSSPDSDFLFDILRGVAALTGHPTVAELARIVAAGPPPDLAIAFNHKQIGSKLWLIDRLFETLGGVHAHILVLGGWYGALSALLDADRRFTIGYLTSVDIDPACAPIARQLNRRRQQAGGFTALSADMLALTYAGTAALTPSLIVNTSCEHLADVGGWIETLPKTVSLVLQSNDYFREPDHRSCVHDLEAFERQTGLGRVLYRGSLPTKNYTRFMLIGTRGE